MTQGEALNFIADPSDGLFYVLYSGSFSNNVGHLSH